MLGVSPYLTFSGNCRQAIEFYRNALDAQVLFTQTFGESPMAGMGPADNIMHCAMKVGDSNIMMSDDPQPGANKPTGGPISLAISIDTPERAKQLFTNLSQGGTVIMPIEKTFWADAFGMLNDQFGIKWMINCEARK